MALALPHDLVFAPLDVLTAEEMNNLMDDLNFISQQFPVSGDNIANSSITTAKLATYAVGASNINWSTMGNSFVAKDLPDTQLTTSYATALTTSVASLPTGAEFLVIGQHRWYNNSDNIIGVNTRLSYGSSLSREVLNVGVWGQTTTIVGGFMKLANQSTVQLQVNKDNPNIVTQQWASLAVIRIA